MPFVKKYEVNGIVPEEKTISGYGEMYQHLADQLRTQGRFLVVELGTNHPELNVQELNRISKKAPLHVFLCVAPIDVCRTRSLERGRAFDADALERRLQRNFPQSHLQLLKDASIEYTVVDMELDLQNNEKKINAALSSQKNRRQEK